MTILEFIEHQYPIADIVKSKLTNPIKAVEEADNLPYDAVGLDETGNLVKQVEVSDGVYIPVVELISYSEDDIVKTKDENLISVWRAYMGLIDVQDIEIADIMSAARQHSEIRKRRERMLSSVLPV